MDSNPSKRARVAPLTLAPLTLRSILPDLKPAVDGYSGMGAFTEPTGTFDERYATLLAARSVPFK